MEAKVFDSNGILKQTEEIDGYDIVLRRLNGELVFELEFDLKDGSTIQIILPMEEADSMGADICEHKKRWEYFHRTSRNSLLETNMDLKDKPIQIIALHPDGLSPTEIQFLQDQKTRLTECEKLLRQAASDLAEANRELGVVKVMTDETSPYAKEEDFDEFVGQSNICLAVWIERVLSQLEEARDHLTNAPRYVPKKS